MTSRRWIAGDRIEDLAPTRTLLEGTLRSLLTDLVGDWRQGERMAQAMWFGPDPNRSILAASDQVEHILTEEFEREARELARNPIDYLQDYLRYRIEHMVDVAKDPQRWSTEYSNSGRWNRMVATRALEIKKDESLERSACILCGMGVVLDPEDGWLHDNADRNRRCYAASFNEDTGEWDESLKRGWSATPAERDRRRR